MRIKAVQSKEKIFLEIPGYIKEMYDLDSEAVFEVGVYEKNNKNLFITFLTQIPNHRTGYS